MAISTLRVLLLSAVVTTAVLPAPSAHAAALTSPQILRFDGGHDDFAGAMTVDAAGNTYLGGAVSDTGFTVVKLDPSGGLVWRYTYGGSQGGVGGFVHALTRDAAGSVYAVGEVRDRTTIGAIASALVVKLSSNGVEQWARRQTGDGEYSYRRVAVDFAGDVDVTGTTNGGATGADWLTQQFSPLGTLQWSARFSGPARSDDTVSDLALRPDGGLVVVGQSTDDSNLVSDAEVSVLDAHGQTMWQRSFSTGDISAELVSDVEVDAAGRITVTGSTAPNPSPEFGIPLPLTLQYDAAGTLLQTQALGGQSITLDKVNNAYLAGAFSGPGTDGQSTVAKLDPSGQVVWRTALPSAANDFLFVVGIAVDSKGEITVAASEDGALTVNRDYLTLHYAADGHLVWSHRFDGSDHGADTPVGVAVDGQDAALVGGTTRSSGSAIDDLVALKFPAGVTPGGGGAAPPAAPSALTATALSRSSIRLNWQDNATDETGYSIERCTGASCTAFVPVATVGANVTSFTDSGLRRSTSFTYRVRAVNANGSSAFSNVATAKTRLL